MNIAVRFEQVALKELDELRDEYLDSLSAAQEALLEVQLPSATSFLIRHEQESVGYALVLADAVVEFHVRTEHAVFGQTVFDQLLDHTLAKRALIKSFDALFLSSCIDRQTQVRSLGLMVRDYVRRALPEAPMLRFSMRPATLDDLPRLHALDQQVFMHPERLRMVLERGYLRLFEQDELVLGLGLMRPVVEGRPAVEVGLALDRAQRSRGFGPYLLQALADECVAQGLTPVCSCSIDNRAVRAAGERIGMYAKHRLLELTF